MNEVMQRNNGLESISPARGENIHIMFQRFLVKQRGRSGLVNVRWLDPAPLDPDAKSVEA
jgi:hypothetical protein